MVLTRAATSWTHRDEATSWGGSGLEISDFLSGSGGQPLLAKALGPKGVRKSIRNKGKAFLPGPWQSIGIHEWIHR